LNAFVKKIISIIRVERCTPIRSLGDNMLVDQTHSHVSEAFKA